ncbi:MAG: DUF1295 domain-containing protein [candidate division KSB1 bacterium]|nr:DUF1295 domain-containing protein [candidate division KSB1 bacterium]MDZ7273883.1 DUF1295 domain-containing protein [candidate division KSB1 bacterium]MDZ7286039.1 DUF1295 domain-containing protein [candidate division KSB1 bacterium]MDZ7299071.1 DUF1295 domain-containing protein [candidate division KSB1 bacterium]MDZ7308208.1 DUF1295 domain-containing protein [candidate division KSB1 bacterium]
MLAQSLALTSSGWLLVSLLMTGLWLIHLRIKNAGLVDFGWALGLALLALLYGRGAQGFLPRRLLITAMAMAWGLRLAFFLLFTRYLGREEEGRYRELRRRWQRHVGLKFFVFFQAQALLAVVLSLPFLLACLNPAPRLTALEWSAAGLWLAAFVGETTADWQLHRFKSNPENRGKTCRTGWWHYSRHPNYFFESLIWMAYALFALASPLGWLALSAPLLMLLAIFKVTGIPATEAQALRSRGQDYREYQRTTSMFVPWLKKNLRPGL